MQHNFDYLKDFEKYFLNETALKEKKELERLSYNFMKAKTQLDLLKSSMDKALFEKRLKEAEAHLDALNFIHNTNLESIISILQTKSIMCLDFMEAMNIFYEPSNAVYEMGREMWGYVYLTLGHGNWLHGMYELCFEKNMDELQDALFLPSGVLNYEDFNIKEHMMDMADWREYLSEYIALSFENPGSYIDEVPLHMRPQFLFEGQISLQRVEAVNCATPMALSALTSTVKKLFGEKHEILKKVRLSSDYREVTAK